MSLFDDSKPMVDCIVEGIDQERGLVILRRTDTDEVIEFPACVAMQYGLSEDKDYQRLTKRVEN